MDHSAITVPGHQGHCHHHHHHHHHHPPPHHQNKHHHHHHHHDEPDSEYLCALQVTLLTLAARPTATVAQTRTPATDAQRKDDDDDADDEDDDQDDHQDYHDGDSAGDDGFRLLVWIQVQLYGKKFLRSELIF